MAITINGKNPIPPGPPGLSPYQVASAGGYTGTEAEFNVALAGMADVAVKAEAALPKAGGTMTGSLVAANPAAGVLGIANQVYVAGDAAIGDQPNGTTVFRYEVVT